MDFNRVEHGGMVIAYSLIKSWGYYIQLKKMKKDLGCTIGLRRKV